MIDKTLLLQTSAGLWAVIILAIALLFIFIKYPLTKFEMQALKNPIVGIRKRAVVKRYYLFKLFLLVTIWEGKEKKHRFYIRKIGSSIYKKLYSKNIQFLNKSKHEKIKQQPNKES